MCSDIEKNPGQYNFAGIVQTSFSQSHGKFIVTQGIQCTCISLYSVCFSSEDLQYVIVKGDQLYKEQNTLTL